MASQKAVRQSLAVLTAAYPSTAKADRETMREFMVLAEQALAPYPEDVLARMVNPRLGIIAECSFFPSIAELKRYCDRAWERMAPRTQAALSPAEQFSAEVRAANRARIVALFKDLRNEIASKDTGRP